MRRLSPLLAIAVLVVIGCSSAPMQPQTSAYGERQPVISDLELPTFHSPWYLFQTTICCAQDDQLVRDPLGRIWFTDHSGFLNTIDQDFRQSSVSLDGASPNGIALGPDHRIWYADAHGGVGKLTTLGLKAQIVKYATPGYSALRIVSGRFNYLWVTLHSFSIGSAIGRVSTTGSVTVYPLPIQTRGGIWGLTIGPRGEVWFTDLGGYIGKFDPSTKKIIEFPTPGFSPANIASGSDGKLYIVSPQLSTDVGVISPTGAFQTIPTDLTEVDDIARGPDGHIWIDGEDASGVHWELARRELSGFVDHVYPHPPTCDIGTIPMGGLTPGDRGDIWFVAEGVCYYGRRGQQPIGWIGDYVR